MNAKTILAILAIGFLLNVNAQTSVTTVLKNPSKEVIIEIQVPKGFDQKGFERVLGKGISEVKWTNANNIDIKADWKTVESNLKEGSIKWVVSTDGPIKLNTGFARSIFFANPGDSIQISIAGNFIGNYYVVYSGKGAETMNLQSELEGIQSKLVKPFGKGQGSYIFINSQERYFEWMKYLDKRLKIIEAVLESYEGKVEPSIFELIKRSYMGSVERERADAFMMLNNYKNKPGKGLTASRLIEIADSTLNNKWSVWLRKREDWRHDTWYFYQFNRIQVWKRWNFDVSDSTDTDFERREIYYRTLKNNFKGLLRERLLQYFIAEECIKELGYLHPTTKTILTDYYTQAGYPEYKEWMKEFEEVAKKKHSYGTSEPARSMTTAMKLAISKDGPYIFNENGKKIAYSIKDSKLIKQSLSSLSATTDENKSFTIKLQKQIAIPPTVYAQPGNLLVLSDIEGNFDALRLLLQKNNVIDNEFDWMYGKGHLVFCGDLFDRGEQVTECLWLIYSLEEKARKAGGFVHFILGNHEVLNLSGDIRYVKEKYTTNANVLKKTYKEMYGENTELGRWLRSKNIMEKIGDVLYTHAGVSKEMNAIPLSLQEINDKIRPHYSNRDAFKASKKEPELRVLFNSKISPFWYRGYYKDPVTSMGQVDSTLQKFGVRRIITGHTIVADTISVHYGGKVINTDTHHASGKSEALLIEGDKYYRVNQEGERKLLFIDGKQNKTN